MNIQSQRPYHYVQSLEYIPTCKIIGNIVKIQENYNPNITDIDIVVENKFWEFLLKNLQTYTESWILYWLPPYSTFPSENFPKEIWEEKILIIQKDKVVAIPKTESEFINGQFYASQIPDCIKNKNSTEISFLSIFIFPILIVIIFVFYKFYKKSPQK